MTRRNGSRIWQQTCICLVVRGQGRYRSDGDWQPVEPGTIFLHPRGRDHLIERQQPELWSEWSLTIDPGLGDLLAALGMLPPDWSPGPRTARMAAARRLQAVLDDRDRDDSAVLIAVQQFLHAVRPSSDTGDILQAAANTLAADLCAELAISAIAEQCSWSAVHFRRVFHQRFGCSPATYRDRSRMQRAEILLRDEGLSVAATARLLGYATPFACSRRFKETHGYSPKQWLATIM